MLNHKSLSSTQVYARLSVAPVRLALDDQAERMLGPVAVSVVMLLAPVTPQTHQTPGWLFSRDEEGEEWPG